uniref:Nucleotide-diphospho-sugar transferase domain-containing protein n=1 Tax=Leersia perrieri TaxID=77586 RepID=A0A0D9W8P8_9ORYZ
MARPPRRPFPAPPRSLQPAAAALFLAVLVALPFAVLYRAVVSQSRQDSWERDPRPSLAASEEDGIEGDDPDADIMWFRNPFPHFYPDGDFQIACDHYFGNATDLRNIANGGFNYVKSNERSIEFYSFWYSSRLRYPGLHDQDVFNVIKHDPYVADIGLKIKFLGTSYFGGFCEPSRDLNRVCTVHANCCIGLQSKPFLVTPINILMENN